MLHFIAFLKMFMLHFIALLLHFLRYLCCIILPFIAFMFGVLVANYPFYIAFYCSYFLTILEGVKIFDCIYCKVIANVAKELLKSPEG